MTQVTGPERISKPTRKADDVVTLRGTWMRGGTSKCWLFNAVDVGPVCNRLGDLDGLLASAFGSGDVSQLDGVGGGSSTTSKAAIVSRSTDPGIDIDYLFAQVAIGHREVEWGSNCGNCATAIGLYALQAGLVAVDPVCTTSGCATRTPGPCWPRRSRRLTGSFPPTGTPRCPVPPRWESRYRSRSAASRRRWPHCCRPARAVDTVTAGGRAYRGTLVTAGAPAALFPANQFGLTGAEEQRRHRRKSAAAGGIAPPVGAGHGIEQAG